MTMRIAHQTLGLTLYLLLCPWSLAAQPTNDARAQLERAIDEVLDTEALANGWWGVMVVEMQTGEVLYRRHAERSFVPASNTKLYTTAAALDLLGPDYRYRTEVFIDGPVVDGVLEGNVIVRGSGDPVIGGRFVFELSERWLLTLKGDIGGFGAGSKLTWGGTGLLGYRLTPSTTLGVGYRYYAFDSDSGKFKIDTQYHGPMLGLVYRF